MIKPRVWLAVGIGLVLTSCIPPRKEKILTEIRTDVLTDPEYQRIYNLQDRLLSDSLFPYLHHSDPTYRLAAAMAFASIRDSSAVDSLAQALHDPIGTVRQAAAYALGQIGSAKAESPLIKAFDPYDSLGLSTPVNASILEALGKCGSAATLEQMSSVVTYRHTDTLLLLGQIRGIYRFGLRGIVCESGTKRMADVAIQPAYPVAVRLIAANYLARAAKIQLDTFSGPLAQSAPSEPDPSIRMALAAALGKVKRPVALDTLVSWFPREADYRVKVNLIRAFANFDYARSRDLVIAALKDPQVHVANRAAQFFLEYGQPNDAIAYWRLSRDTLLSAPIKAALLGAAQRHLPAFLQESRGAINQDSRVRFEMAQKPYNKAAYLRALGEYGWNYRYLFRAWTEAQHPAVRSAAAEALAGISAKPDFEKYFGLGHRKIAAEFAEIFKAILLSGDAGPMAIAAGALRQPTRQYRIHFDTLTFIDTALAVLELPRDQETYQEIQQTEAFLRTGKAPAPAKPTFNHPINWDLIGQLGRKPKAVITTSKGRIELDLFPAHAPGTVANFVALAKDGFFNGKNFHRVVPNFVIQGGCPRGDGYGSLDYTIRSELAPMYYDGEGYVGMASAGNHTEGTQFFITHSPTPHLDGNYTIFARVSKGMDVVHQIQVGDLIEKVNIP